MPWCSNLSLFHNRGDLVLNSLLLPYIAIFTTIGKIYSVMTCRTDEEFVNET